MLKLKAVLVGILVLIVFTSSTFAQKPVYKKKLKLRFKFYSSMQDINEDYKLIGSERYHQVNPDLISPNGTDDRPLYLGIIVIIDKQHMTKAKFNPNLIKIGRQGRKFRPKKWQFLGAEEHYMRLSKTRTGQASSYLYLHTFSKNARAEDFYVYYNRTVISPKLSLNNY